MLAASSSGTAIVEPQDTLGTRASRREGSSRVMAVFFCHLEQVMLRAAMLQYQLVLFDKSFVI
jgi:hypothetical protein